MFVKKPVAGRVKTRLAGVLGDAAASELYAAFVADLANRFRQTGDFRVLYYTPDERAAADYFDELARSDYELWPQPAGDLGTRLSGFFARAFRQGAERAVVIGSDSPTLPLEYVVEAFERLAAHDCVLGPSTDGGYYLLGQRGRGRSLFEEVEWSTPRVLSQTVHRIQSEQATLSLLPVWYDVDTYDDFCVLNGHLEAMQASGRDAIDCERTANLCRRLSREQGGWGKSEE